MHVAQITSLIKQYTTEQNVNYLNLSSNKISDEGIVAICKSLASSNISTLIVAQNKLTDRCGENIVAALKTNKNLKVLNLAGN